MGVKLMTGATGEQNIEAADDRECLAGLTGPNSYVFDTGSKLKATLVNANTVTIGTGAGSMQGSRFRCPTTTTVTIKSGTQGQYRHDIIGLHFSRAASGKESLEFQVLTGTPASSDGAANDPAYKVGDLLKGDANAFFPLYRVKLSGINAANPEAMFPVLTSLKTLGDSVSQRLSGAKRLWSGWTDSGSITVPGSTEYSLFACTISKADDVLFGVRLNGDSTINFTANAAWGISNATNMAVVGVRFTANGDKWTFGGGGRYNAGNDYSYGFGGVNSIYGIA